MSKRILLLSWAAALAGWTAIAYYLFTMDLGSIPDLFHPTRLLYYALAVLAPMLTFVPMGRLMNLRSFGAEATIYWAVLITIVTFISPRSAGMPAYLGFMLAFFGAVYSIFLPVGYLAGFKLLTLRVHRRDTGRARREAYLVGLFVSLSAAMNMAGFYNVLNAFLLLLILVLVEVFALAYKPGAQLEY